MAIFLFSHACSHLPQQYNTRGRGRVVAVVVCVYGHQPPTTQPPISKASPWSVDPTQLALCRAGDQAQPSGSGFHAAVPFPETNTDRAQAGSACVVLCLFSIFKYAPNRNTSSYKTPNTFFSQLFLSAISQLEIFEQCDLSKSTALFSHS